MNEGELWQAGRGMSLERVQAADSAGAARGRAGDTAGAPRQPVTVELATGEPLNWLEAQTF